MSGRRQLGSRQRTVLSLPLTNCGKPVADLERSPGGGGHPRGHADTLGLGSLDNLTVDIGMDGNGKFR